MAEAITVEAETREEFGKNEARRMRRSGRIPAVVYGAGGPALSIAVDPRKILAVLQSESGHNAIFTLEIHGKAPVRVMIRDWQAEPVRGDLLHVDMMRIARDAKLRVKVPVHITGEAKGVKVQDGILEPLLREVELECLPDDIPDHITVDVTELMLGQSLRVANLPVGEKVKVLTDPNRVVVHVVALRAVAEEAPAPEVAAAAPAEPEVIRKGKAEAEEGEEGAGAAPETKETKKEGKKEGKKES